MKNRFALFMALMVGLCSTCPLPAALVRTATEGFVTNKIAEAVAPVAAQVETNAANIAANATAAANAASAANAAQQTANSALAGATEAYNRATAVGNGAATKTALASAALAATNYTDTAIANIDIPDTPDYSTGNTQLVATIQATAPASGDYANVSNKAVNAVQQDNIDDILTAAHVATADYAEQAGSAAFAEQAGNVANADNAQWAETAGSAISAGDATFAQGAGLAYVANALSLSGSGGTYTGDQIKDAIDGKASPADVLRLVASTNIMLVVTNYDSQVYAPTMTLQQISDTTGEYVVYWDEKRNHAETLTNANAYTDAAVATRAPAAWSRTTSGMGAEAPEGVTWISTPKTVVAGGYEYEKVITSSGAIWILSSNGMTLDTATNTNAFFSVSDTEGNEVFSIEKTDAQLVGVDPAGITRDGNTVFIPFDIGATSHPYIRACTNLVNAAWVKEDENGFSCPFASVVWSGSSGAFVATITCAEPQAYFYFEYLIEGSTAIKHSAPVKIDSAGGFYFGGVLYKPVVNGSKLEFVAQ